METTTGANNLLNPITDIRSRQRASRSIRPPQHLIGLAERDIVWTGTEISVLLVIDDVRLLWRTTMNLSGRGFNVCAISRVEEAPLRVRLDWAPDVILLDVSRPTIEVTAVFRALRSTYAVPVIVAVDPGSQRFLGVEFRGDCLQRPYTADELLQSIAVATSQDAMKNEVLVAAGLVLSLSTRQATLDGELLRLSNDEFVVLWRLISAAGAPISRIELRETLSGLGSDVDARIVDWYVVRLMVKLAESSSLRLVRTGRYDGYAVQIGQAYEGIAPSVVLS